MRKMMNHFLRFLLWGVPVWSAVFLCFISFVFFIEIIPEFLGETEEVQYGVEGQTSKLLLRLRAYPDPKVTWYFHNVK